MPVKNILYTILLAIAPISELRGALPYAFFSGLSLPLSFCISVFFNALVPLIAFLFLETVNKLLLKMTWYSKFFNNYLSKTRKKIEPKIQKYGYWGLMFFVGIPLPITGAWTGSVGAWLLKMNKKKSYLFIVLGLLISATIVTILIFTGKGLNSILIKRIN